MKNHNGNGYPSFSTQNSGFFTRHMRRISSSLPRFGGSQSSSYKDKHTDNQWIGQNMPFVGRVRSVFARMSRKLKLRLLFGAILIFCLILFYNTRE
jgi:mannan polymerase II complex MNN10 subunit